jgi:Leucine-rich repeat (LRR) protein
MPALRELFMANNAVTVLGGWEGMPALKKLHLRRNKIDKVQEEEFVPLEQLEYLNLRANKIASMDTLAQLLKNPILFDISVLNNPVEQNCSNFNVLMADVLSKQPKMIRFCKV